MSLFELLPIDRRTERTLAGMDLTELINDLRESLVDLTNATLAKAMGITQCSTGSIDQRIENNQRFIQLIMAEIERRNEIGRGNHE